MSEITHNDTQEEMVSISLIETIRYHDKDLSKEEKDGIILLLLEMSIELEEKM